MPKMFKQLTAFLVLGCSLNPLMGTTAGVLRVSPDKRLNAAISKDSMNRITVANDRITHVFGDEESYVLQTEEHSGQIFLKPTADNGNKPLSLTLMTENGLTQDLTLEPTQKGATTLILKPLLNVSASDVVQNDGFKGATGRGGPRAGEVRIGGFYPPDSSPREVRAVEGGTSIPEQLVQAVKCLVTGRGAVEEGETRDRSVPAGFQVAFKKAYQVGILKGCQFEVTNTTDTSIEIDEKAFYQLGDLALSFTNRVLPSQGTTLMTVVHL